MLCDLEDFRIVRIAILLPISEMYRLFYFLVRIGINELKD